MPRRRPDPWQQRAAELAQQQRDRAELNRLRQAQLHAAEQLGVTPPTAEAAEPAPQPAPPPDATPEPSWDSETWQLNSRVSSLMAQRYGAGWSRSPGLQRTAERALSDLRGLGDGRTIARLRTTGSNGSYSAALDAKFGPLL